MTVQEKLAAFKPQLETYLKGCLKNSQPEFEAVYSAMQYSLLLGGKRLRPFILQQFYFLNGGQGGLFSLCCRAGNDSHLFADS